MSSEIETGGSSRTKLSPDDLLRQKSVADKLAAITDKDRAVVAKLIRQAQDPPSIVGGLITAHSPELRGILFVDKEHIVNRATELVAATNLVVSLILSGVIEYGLQPVDVGTFNTSRERTLVEIYNTMGAALLTLTLFCSLYTVYFLMALTIETPFTAYRGLAKGGRYFVVFQKMTTTAAFLVVGMTCIGSAIWSSETGCIVTCSVVWILTIYLFVTFVRAYGRMFPDLCVFWWGVNLARMLVPGIAEDSRRIGQIRTAEATHLTEYLDQPCSEVLSKVEGSKPSQEKSQQELNAEEIFDDLSSLRDFLSKALPRASRDRLEVVAEEMLLEHMTLQTLRKIVACEGGERLLYDALDFRDSASLLRGERMSLIAALSSTHRSR